MTKISWKQKRSTVFLISLFCSIIFFILNLKKRTSKRSKKTRYFSLSVSFSHYLLDVWITNANSERERSIYRVAGGFVEAIMHTRWQCLGFTYITPSSQLQSPQLSGQQPYGYREGNWCCSDRIWGWFFFCALRQRTPWGQAGLRWLHDFTVFPKQLFARSFSKACTILLSIVYNPIFWFLS